MRILKDESIGLVIDMQERLYPFIHNYAELTKSTDILIKGLKILGLSFLVTQQYTKGLGETIKPVQVALGDYEVIEKQSFSCCDNANFMENISTTYKKNVIIAGIEAHVCVLQTVIDLISLGYNPVVVEDCISSRLVSNKEIAVNRMIQEGAVITSVESILFELCRYSGNDTFKKISQLVK